MAVVNPAPRYVPLSRRAVLLAGLLALTASLALAGLAAWLWPSVPSREVFVRLPPGEIAAPFRVGQLAGWVVRHPGGRGDTLPALRERAAGLARSAVGCMRAGPRQDHQQNA